MRLRLKCAVMCCAFIISGSTARAEVAAGFMIGKHDSFEEQQKISDRQTIEFIP